MALKRICYPSAPPCSVLAAENTGPSRAYIQKPLYRKGYKGFVSTARPGQRRRPAGLKHMDGRLFCRTVPGCFWLQRLCTPVDRQAPPVFVDCVVFGICNHAVRIKPVIRFGQAAARPFHLRSNRRREYARSFWPLPFVLAAGRCQSPDMDS